MKKLPITVLIAARNEEANIARCLSSLSPAERVLGELARPFVCAGQEVFVGASVGIALPIEEEATAEAMLRDADLAMYRAKAAGRGRYEVFDHGLHTAAVQLLKLETELRRAVAAGDFVMHYQPIVSLVHGRIVGFEERRDQDGTAGADCRINGEDYEPGMAALRAYVATWPGRGFEFRKQYVFIHTLAE